VESVTGEIDALKAANGKLVAVKKDNAAKMKALQAELANKDAEIQSVDNSEEVNHLKAETERLASELELGKLFFYYFFLLFIFLYSSARCRCVAS
jgi:hypothetical protein